LARIDANCAEEAEIDQAIAQLNPFTNDNNAGADNLARRLTLAPEIGLIRTGESREGWGDDESRVF
jgi:hypothetical protein